MPYVMTYGGGRYTSVAWFKTHAEAQKECDRIKRAGSWSGMPPIVQGDDSLALARHMQPNPKPPAAESA